MFYSKAFLAALLLVHINLNIGAGPITPDIHQHHVKNGAKVVLDCYDAYHAPFNTLNNTAVINITDLKWIIPSHPLMTTNIVSKGWNDNDNRRSVSPDGMKFTITSVIPVFYGDYACAMKTNTSWYYSSQMVNIYGPLVTDFWDKYMWNFIHGGCAAASFLIAICVICLAYKFRYKDDRHMIKRVRRQSYIQEHRRLSRADTPPLHKKTSVASRKYSARDPYPLEREYTSTRF